MREGGAEPISGLPENLKITIIIIHLIIKVIITLIINLIIKLIIICVYN